MKYNQATLDKVERILEEAGYILRNERGTFQSGYCILEDRKVVVLNKFLSTEGRINTLIEIIASLNFEDFAFMPDTQKTYEEVMVRFASDEKK
jgi:hypothetical protein